MSLGLLYMGSLNLLEKNSKTSFDIQDGSTTHSQSTVRPFIWFLLLFLLITPWKTLSSRHHQHPIYLSTFALDQNDESNQFPIHVLFHVCLLFLSREDNERFSSISSISSIWLKKIIDLLNLFPLWIRSPFLFHFLHELIFGQNTIRGTFLNRELPCIHYHIIQSLKHAPGVKNFKWDRTKIKIIVNQYNGAVIRKFPR